MSRAGTLLTTVPLLLMASSSPARAATATNTTACAQAPMPPAVVADVDAVIASAGGEVAVVVEGDCHHLAINADLRMHAASTMKVPVMIELFRQIDVGERSLDDTIRVTDRFTSMIDGSEFVLDDEDDSDRMSYTQLGALITLREACERMITVSSNLTTNLLIDALGIERIRRTVESLGASGMDVRRKVEDGPAYRAGISNTTTAAGLAVLFDAIRRGRAASAASTRDMVAILSRQQFNAGIPAGLPPGTAVAHKTGTITRIHHDAGIVMAKRPYVLVVLTRGFDTEAASDAVIARIARLVHAAMVRD